MMRLISLQNNINVYIDKKCQKFNIVSQI